MKFRQERESSRSEDPDERLRSKDKKRSEVI